MKGYVATSSSEPTPSPAASGRSSSRMRQADQKLDGQKDDGPENADLAAGDRPARRARHLAIVVAVDEVVEGAAGAAHDDGARGEQEQQPEIGPAAGGRGERDRPPAGKQQQPGADGPVEPGKPA